MPLPSAFPSAFLSPFLSPPLSRPSRPSHAIRACQPSAPSPPQPPCNLDETVALASTSLAAVLSTGAKRAKLSAIIPGLNPLIEDTVPYSDSTLNTLAYGLAKSPALSDGPVALLFKSAGTAAAARQFLAPADDKLTFASYFRRDATTARVSKHVNLVVNPTSARGDRVMDDLEAVIAEAPHAVWVLLNPDFGIDRAAVGMREISRRDSFLSSFQNAFYFRNLFEIRRPQLIAVERGALLYTPGGMWRVFALTGGEYIVAEEFDDMPQPETISSCVRAAANASMQKNKTKTPQASEADAQFLKVLALCAAAFAAVYYALAAAQRT